MADRTYRSDLEARRRRAERIFEETGDYDTDMSELEEPIPEPPPYEEVPTEAGEELPTYDEVCPGA
jgi:hypothetical protein